ncbi:MAG: N-acetyltransferase [Devosia sp.]|jgi:predicted GNAT family acetyltransferase|uniref:GNAT family N-acetyltransferase n=1 Tax=unclassified Devosia TaxID=196773 RepID=UPI0019FCA8AE|nr:MULTISPECIES: GNAT family N-acetyltransferase [unclassified Devosia]MBF0677889.1 N-acetyltransferase [Devosia sp.]WEJ33512.1 N-acetyltransferase [Devosia sp. SD17-2]
MAETELKILREEGPTRGRYVIHLAPGAEAEMTYRKAGAGPMIIDHTGVPTEYEGRGIALRLVKAAIADAQEQNFKIKPVCPYVVAQFRRHPEWGLLLG